MGASRSWTVPAIVLAVVDADTVHLRLDLGWRIYFEARCRIAGMNAPELSTPEGVAAKEYAQRQLPVGLPIVFNSHSLDKYGRPLGAISVNGQDYTTAAIAAGHARVM